MRLKRVLAAGILVLTAIILAYLLASGPLFSGPGNYVVTPGTGGPVSGTSANDVPVVSYWSLPLWVQIASAFDGILILIGIMGYFPFIVNKIQNVLENHNRLKIFNYVMDNPGCTQAEITDRENMKNGTVKYHVQMLQLQGKIILKRMGKFTRIFRNGPGNDIEKVIVPYLKNDTSRNLLHAILEKPGVTNQMLADQFFLDKSSVHWHMERFLKDDIVRFEQDGKFKHYYLTPDISKVINNIPY
ncbi:MAG TPA: winged helix-turn-helix transcriptional regulator [Methanocellaceae archaeon]